MLNLRPFSRLAEWGYKAVTVVCNQSGENILFSQFEIKFGTCNKPKIDTLNMNSLILKLKKLNLANLELLKLKHTSSQLKISWSFKINKTEIIFLQNSTENLSELDENLTMILVCSVAHFKPVIKSCACCYAITFRRT